MDTSSYTENFKSELEKIKKDEIQRKIGIEPSSKLKISDIQHVPKKIGWHKIQENRNKTPQFVSYKPNNHFMTTAIKKSQTELSDVNNNAEQIPLESRKRMFPVQLVPARPASQKDNFIVLNSEAAKKPKFIAKVYSVRKKIVESPFTLSSRFAPVVRNVNQRPVYILKSDFEPKKETFPSFIEEEAPRVNKHALFAAYQNRNAQAPRKHFNVWPPIKKEAPIAPVEIPPKNTIFPEKAVLKEPEIEKIEENVKSEPVETCSKPVDTSCQLCDAKMRKMKKSAYFANQYPSYRCTNRNCNASRLVRTPDPDPIPEAPTTPEYFPFEYNPMDSSADILLKMAMQIKVEIDEEYRVS